MADSTAVDAADALDAIVDRHLDELVAVVFGTSAPAGSERPLADALARWATTHAPDLTATVVPIDDDSANLVLRTSSGAPTAADDWANPGGLWWYGHLDTSLSGRPEDEYWLTGAPELRPGHDVIDGRIHGLGVAVSRGPALAGLLAVLALAAETPAAPIGLLLTAGGTHRTEAASGPWDVAPGTLGRGSGRGLAAALDAGWRPDALVNVKGGSSGVLASEPGFAMLAIRTAAPLTAVPARGERPGAAVTAARIALAVESWRPWLRSQPVADPQVGRDLGVGSIRAGVGYKIDMLPAAGEVRVYLVLAPGDDPQEWAAMLADHLRRTLAVASTDAPADDPASGDLDGLEVEVLGHQAGAATPLDRAIVVDAVEAYEAVHGAGSATVAGYTGSTDGAMAREHGIDTVRLGPTASSDPDRPGWESLELAEIVDWARLYVRLARRHVARAAGDDPHAQPTLRPDQEVPS